MGLETNIYKAFEKNLKYIDNDGKEVNPLNDSVKGKAKVEELSKDLSLAIRDFILAQTFRVNKLYASTGPVKTLPGATSVGITVGAPAPHSVPPIVVPPIPIGILTVEVDKDGQGSGNPVGGGKPQSDASEVKLRKNEVEKL